MKRLGHKGVEELVADKVREIRRFNPEVREKGPGNVYALARKEIARDFGLKPDSLRRSHARRHATKATAARVVTFKLVVPEPLTPDDPVVAPRLDAVRSYVRLAQEALQKSAAAEWTSRSAGRRRRLGV